MILIVLISGCTTQSSEVKPEIKGCTNSCKSNEIRTSYPDCKCVAREPELVECDSCEQMIFGMLGICTTTIGREIERKYTNSSMKIIKDKCLHNMIFRINSTVIFVCGKGTTCYDSYIRITENGTLKGNFSCIIENNTQYVYLEVTPGLPAPIRPNFLVPGYVYTLQGNSLVKLNPDFTINSSFGNFYDEKSDNTGFYGPQGVAVDKNGYVYVYDHNNHRLVKLNPKLTFESAYSPVGSNGNCYTPVAVDKDGYIYSVNYVPSLKNPVVLKLNPDFSLKSTFNNSMDSVGWFQGVPFGPVGVAVDKNGYVYVADDSGHRIIKLSSDLKYVSTFNLSNQPRGIAIDSRDYVYVLNWTSLIRIDPDFVHSTTTQYSSNNIAIDKNDYVYMVSDYDYGSDLNMIILNPDLSLNSTFEDLPYRIRTMTIAE